MRDIVKEFQIKFGLAGRLRRRALSVITVLAVLVSVGVYWQLHSTGTAMTNTASCGVEEHTHTDECYALQLTCNLDEGEEHSHTDACYASVLVCEMVEHTHTIACLSDLSADTETADDWTATLPELTGNTAADLVAVAESQLGYAESTANFQLGEDGVTRTGYTRYGAWYGNAYGDWDAMFAAFCVRYAGCEAELYANASGAYSWYVRLNSLDLISSEVEPAAGLLVFFDNDNDGKADGVGIITAVEGDSLTVIQGDYDDAVAAVRYDANDSCILCYGLVTEGAETEPTVEVETVTYTATADGATVTVVAALGALPEGAELSVTLVEESSQAYSEAAEAIGFDDSQEDAGLVVLDITFTLNGEEVEPTEAVQVTIDAAQLIPEEVDLTTVEVQHLEQTEDGVEAVLVADAGEGMDTETAVAEFTVDSFSSFTITWGTGSNNNRSVTVTLKDTDGNELSASTSNVTINSTSTNVTFADQAPTISGYTYSYTTVTYSVKSGNSTTTNTVDATTFRISSYTNGTYTIYINGTSYSNVSSVSVTMYYTADSSSSTTVSAAGTITWTVDSTDMTYGVNAYSTSGSTISMSSSRITSFTGNSLLMDTLASNTVISSSSSGGGGGGGQSSSSTSYVLSYATVVIDGTTYGSSDNGVIKLERSEVDEQGYITYTITYADNTTQTVTQEYGTEDYTAPIINLYYTTSSSSYALTQSNYVSSSYLWYDVSKWTTTSTAGQDSDNRDKIDSITLNGVTVVQGDSSKSSSFGSTDGTTASTLTDYFGSSVDTSTTGTLTLSIKAADGYYVTEIVIACCGGSIASSKPYSCGTFTSGSAFDQEFSVSADGTVTVEISSAYFGHSSSSSNYFILIFVAPVPSPLYVEYDYGDIVSLIGSGTSTAFESGTGWTTASDSNVYVYSDSTDYSSNDALDKISGVLTNDTQFKYVYSRSDNEDTSNWVHVANSITTEAIEQAAAAGYYFAGWKACYYTEMDSVSNGNDSAIYDYTLNFSETSLFSTQTFGAGDTVALLTNVRLVAQWEPYTVTVTKTISGLPTSDSTNRTYTFTLEVSNDGGSTWTTVSNSIQITVSGANPTVTYTISAASNADYTYVVTPGMMFRLTENTDSLTTVTIGSDSYYYGGVNYSPQTGTVSASNTTVALSAVNVYSSVEPVHIQKVDQNGNSLGGATFTLQRSSDNAYYTGTSWSSYSRTITLGSLTLGGLADGTYTLTETAAPDGYNGLDAAITFTMSNGTVTEVKYGGVSADSSELVSYDSDTRTITVVNTSGVELPSTGAAGTILYTMMGLLLMGTATCLLLNSRRRKGAAH